MSLSSTTSRNDYTGSGTDTYAYSFRIQSSSDLEVIKRTISSGAETTLTLTTDYTVSGVGSSTGGNVVLVAGNLSSSYHLTIRRKVSLTQATDIRNEGDFLPETLEDEYDRIVMQLQYLYDEIARSIRTPKSLPTSSLDPQLALPLTATYLLRINAAGTGVDVASPADVVSAASGDFLRVANDLSDVSSPANARSNLKISRVTGSKATPTDVVGSSGITPTSGYFEQMIFVQGSGGAVDITANPQIAAGTLKGQVLELIGCDDTKYIKLEHGTGLDMNGSINLALNCAIRFRWDETNWVEVSRSERGAV